MEHSTATGKDTWLRAFFCPYKRALHTLIGFMIKAGFLRHLLQSVEVIDVRVGEVQRHRMGGQAGNPLSIAACEVSSAPTVGGLPVGPVEVEGVRRARRAVRAVRRRGGVWRAAVEGVGGLKRARAARLVVCRRGGGAGITGVERLK